jgi:hypothetical protein
MDYLVYRERLLALRTPDNQAEASTRFVVR